MFRVIAKGLLGAVLASCLFVGGVMAYMAVSGGDYRVRMTSGFTDSDIRNIETEIRAKFEEREGVRVKTVSLIRRSSKELDGFVTLDSGLLKNVVKNCDALRDGIKTVWRCS